MYCIVSFFYINASNHKTETTTRKIDEKKKTENKMECVNCQKKQKNKCNIYLINRIIRIKKIKKINKEKQTNKQKWCKDSIDQDWALCMRHFFVKAAAAKWDEGKNVLRQYLSNTSVDKLMTLFWYLFFFSFFPFWCFFSSQFSFFVSFFGLQQNDNRYMYI